MAESLKDRIISILISKKLITEQNLNDAMNVQKEKGGRLGQILLDLGFISQKDLMLAISQNLDIPPINLTRFKIDPSLMKLIPQNVAVYYQIIPVSLIADVLTVAMVDPLNIFAIDDLKFLTGYEIRPVITTQHKIEEALNTFYGQATHANIEKLLDDIKSPKAQTSKSAAEILASEENLKLLTQQAPVVKINNLILTEAVKLKSSDILIEPLENKLRIRYRIDGLLYEVPSPPKSIHEAIVSRIKVMSGLNIAEHRLPQDGRFKANVLSHIVDFRVSILPSSLGEKVAMRILDKSQIILDIEKLGFEETALNDIKDVSLRPHGMILITGPTGSGKTTTLYSLIKLIDSPQKNIITVEDPVEFDLEGINQVTIRPEIELTFANCLRSILRQDPDIIMIGEIRDFDTVDIAIKAALTGHLVLSTLHTTTSVGAVVRLLNMGVEPFLISSSLLMVGSQRLLRKICTKCKESYVPTSLQLERFMLPAGKDIHFYRGRGCSNCLNTGFSGRTALMETLILTPRIKELILQNAQEAVIKTAAMQGGMKTLRQNAIEKILNGTTTVEEVMRTTVDDE